MPSRGQEYKVPTRRRVIISGTGEVITAPTCLFTIDGVYVQCSSGYSSRLLDRLSRAPHSIHLFVYVSTLSRVRSCFQFVRQKHSRLSV